MTEKKRQVSRPRIDTICKAIVEGTYDDQITTIQDAINTRKSNRRAEVEALVLEVYGEGHVVVPKPNPFIKKPHGIGTAITPSGQPGTIYKNDNGAEPQPEGKTSVQVTPDAFPEIPGQLNIEDEIESHSPIIGGFDPANGAISSGSFDPSQAVPAGGN